MAKTSLPQTWHIPRGAKITPTTADSVEVCNTAQPYDPQAGPPNAIRSTLYDPTQGKLPDWNILKKELHNDKPELLVMPSLENMSLTMVDTKFGPAPRGSLLSYQQPLDGDLMCNVHEGIVFPNLPVLNVMENNYNTVLDNSSTTKFNGLSISPDESVQLEKNTRDQSQNPLFYKLRENRLTASKFHQPWLVIRTFHQQGRCSRGGHLCNKHSEEKYSSSYK